MFDTFAVVDGWTVAATLAGAVVGAVGAIWGGHRAAEETAKAETKRQAFARGEKEAACRAAARVVELQLAGTCDLFRRAPETGSLPTTFEIPIWDDLRVLSSDLGDRDWNKLAEAMQWLRYVRTLAAGLAATSAGRVSGAGDSQLVAVKDIQDDIREALPRVESAVELVRQQLGGSPSANREQVAAPG